MRRVPAGAVLLWGLPDESVLNRVALALRRFGVTPVVIDQRLFRETRVELMAGDPVGGTIRCGPWTLDLSEVRATYLRPYESRRLPGLANEQDGSQLLSHVFDIDELLTAWADVTPSLVVNRPYAMATNGSKPMQAAQAKLVGFSTPETLLTTDPDEASAFWQRHGEVIYKSISGVRSVVQQLDKERSVRLRYVQNCPTQFQKRIRGTNYRVHVVGAQVFASRITS
jgi:hypothetical protein